MTAQLDTPARRITAALAIALLGASSLLGCSSSGDGEPADEDRSTTTEAEATTTTEAEATTTEAEGGEDEGSAGEEPSQEDIEEGLTDGFVEEFRTTLEGSTLSAAEVDCVMETFEQALAEGLGEAEVAAGYEDCGLTANRIGAATVFSTMVEGGVDEEAARCFSDELAALDDAALDALFEDDAAMVDLATGCGVPADAM